MNNLVSLDIVRTILNVKVTPKQPEEVLVQRQLEHWLHPGWCMSPPAGSESKVNRKSKLMLWWIAGALILLGLVGLVASYPMGGLISVALVLVIVIALVGLILGKMPPSRKEELMNLSKCPHCGVRLGNFLYADACPHCHEELKHNTRPLLSAPKHDLRKAKLWPVRMFTSLLQFVES